MDNQNLIDEINKKNGKEDLQVNTEITVQYFDNNEKSNIETNIINKKNTEDINDFEVFESNLEKRIHTYKPNKYNNRLIKKKEKRKFTNKKLGNNPKGIMLHKMGTVIYTLNDKDVIDIRR